MYYVKKNQRYTRKSLSFHCYFKPEQEASSDASAHTSSRRLLTTILEPALQLSVSQQEISQVTEPPVPSLQIGLLALSQVILGAQPF